MCLYEDERRTARMLDWNPDGFHTYYKLVEYQRGYVTSKQPRHRFASPYRNFEWPVGDPDLMLVPDGIEAGMDNMVQRTAAATNNWLTAVRSYSCNLLWDAPVLEYGPGVFHAYRQRKNYYANRARKSLLPLALLRIRVPNWAVQSIGMDGEVAFVACYVRGIQWMNHKCELAYRSTERLM